jgi:hypothetical protein
MESELVKVMEFFLFPTTINYWANYYMVKWDIYATANLNNFNILRPTPDLSTPLFKSSSTNDYDRFRSLMQAADLIVLDLSHHNYNARHLVAACFYF